MQFSTWYKNNFEDRLKGRYICLEHIQPILNDYDSIFEIKTVGVSEMGKDIPLITFGSGRKKVLMWSQMHGNESTTTKAIFDFLKLIATEQEISEKIKTAYTFYILPILNPDGAALYTRENANKIDLNRDAQALTQRESVILKNIFTRVNPDLCLNMHDQRTIFGLNTGLPASVSFLTPAADPSRSVTPARKEAMVLIVKMQKYLNTYCEGQIGRFDDSFNINCVGDTFSSLNVPTILFEAGHFQEDYTREKTRELIFYALLSLFDLDGIPKFTNIIFNDYFLIPENKKNFKDIALTNVTLKGVNELKTIYLQYKEVLLNKQVTFDLHVDSIENSKIYNAHKTIDFKGNTVLFNYKEQITINMRVTSIFDKTQNLKVF